MKSTSLGRILIVDDEQNFSKAIQNVVRACGGETVAVNTIAAAKECLHGSSDWAAFVVDENLAPGSGLKLIGEIRSSGGTFAVVPTLLVSGSDDKYLCNRARALGADCLFKPFGWGELKDWLMSPCHVRHSKGSEEKCEEIIEQWQRLYGLTAKECNLLVLASRGEKSRVEIAEEMGCRQTTLEKHCHNLIQKTGDRSLSETVARLLRATSDLGLPKSTH